MTAELLQIIFVIVAVYAVVAWAERIPRRRHEEGCDICSRRSR